MGENSFFIMMLREAKDDLKVALKSAPDEGYEIEIQRCVNRLEELLDRCAQPPAESKTP